MRVRYLALLCCVLFLGLSAHACSCASMGSQCGALHPNGTLFLGEVTGERSVRVPANFPGRNDLFFSNRVFRIRVVEAFAGTLKAGEDVDIRTGNGGGDCGYGFVVGHRYLVDAYEQKPENEVADLRGVVLGTGICSRTQEEGSAGIALRELRTALAHGRQPDLHGSIRFLEGQYAYPGKPIASLGVALTSQRDGTVFHAQTDTEGIYTFATLPPGDYVAAFALPPRQQLVLYDDSKPPHVTIPANDGTGLACHLDAEAGPTGGIRVRVVDRDGKPQPGSAAAHRAGEQSGGSEWSDHGTFELQYLPDGEYRLEFSNYSTRMRGTGSTTVRNGAIADEVVIVAVPFTR